MSARRSSLTSSRRRSGGAGQLRLGAVKLQSPMGPPESDAGSPTSVTGSEPTSSIATPLDLSPLALDPSRSAADGGHVAAPAVAADSVAQFSRQLAANRCADRWLEEESSGLNDKGPPRRQQSLPAASDQRPEQLSRVSPAATTESAASQIVHKALRFITADAAPDVRTPAGPAPPRKPGGTFDSQSFLDKGIDAIGSVGRLMEGFALTLDTVIGQAFEDWGSSGASQHAAKPPVRRLAPQTSTTAAVAAGKENVASQAAAGAAGAAAKPRPHIGSSSSSGATGRQPHITSFMSKLDAVTEQEAVEWRRRAQQLAGELQRMRAQQEEYQRLRLQYEKLHADLQQASSHASQLAQENSQLKSQGGPPGADPLLADPLAARQVALQMEALLAEKSKLAAENDRLLRENTGLQELLEFTVAHQSQLAADGELFGYDVDDGVDDGMGLDAGMEALAVSSPGPCCPLQPAQEGSQAAHDVSAST